MKHCNLLLISYMQIFIIYINKIVKSKFYHWWNWMAIVMDEHLSFVHVVTLREQRQISCFSLFWWRWFRTKKRVEVTHSHKMIITWNIKPLTRWLIYFTTVSFLHNTTKVVNLYTLPDMVEGGPGCLVHLDLRYHAEERCRHYWVFSNNSPS